MALERIWKVDRTALLVYTSIWASGIARECHANREFEWDEARGRLRWRPGENYFRIDGRPMFVLGRNPAGTSLPAYEDHSKP